MGKMLVEKMAINLTLIILKSYRIKTLYHMILISAELHSKYKPAQSIEENLKGLETYHTLLDPCSGKPYKWNGKKQVLYSLGTDRDDDAGKSNYKSIDTDFAIPVILYVK